MISYDYECLGKVCGHSFQVLRSITEDVAVVVCPVCGTPAQQIISGRAAFILKGEGFHGNDYPSGSLQRSVAREHEDIQSGLNRKDRCQRGDFRQCRDNDKILSDYKKFKGGTDREKIKDEYDTA